MSDLTTPALPERIEREDFLAAIRSLGIDPDTAHRVELTPDEVLVTVFKYKDDGSRVLNPAEDGYLKATVAIPVSSPSAFTLQDASPDLLDPSKLVTKT